MIYATDLLDSFWSVCTAFVPLIVPIIAIILIFKIVNGFLK